MTMPDSTFHNPDPSYIRKLVYKSILIDKATSQANVANIIGIDPRTLRYYMQVQGRKEGTPEAPYTVQYALEQLARENT